MTDYQRLIDRYLDFELSQKEAQSLEAWLLEEPRHVDLFVDATVVHRQIHAAMHAERLMTNSAAKTGYQSNLESQDISRSTAIGLLASATKKLGDFISKPTPLSISMAFLVVACALSALALVSTGPNRKAATKRVTSASQLELKIDDAHVATIVALRDCVWNDALEARRRGEALEVNDVVQFERGLMQIAFHSGATAVMEGPIRFRVDSDNGVQLLLGRSTFRAPETARGFTVRTASARIIDLGTEFGVVAGESGETETHVLSGCVQAQSISPDGRRSQWYQVFEQQSIRLTAKESQAVYANCSPRQFIWNIDDDTRAAARRDGKAGAENESLWIDFNQSEPDVSPTMTGFVSVNKSAKLGMTISSDLGAEGAVTLSLPNLDGPLPERDRGRMVDSRAENEKSDLLRDFIFTPAKVGRLDVVLADLKPGEYSFVGYFHDSDKSRGEAKISASVDGGKSFHAGATATYSTSASPAIIGSGVASFVADGIQDVVIRIQGEKVNIINGFQLRRQATRTENEGRGIDQ